MASPVSPAKQNDAYGIVLMLVSMLSFALSDSFIKAAQGSIGFGQIIFYLGVGGTVLFTIGAVIRGENPLPRSYLEPPVLLRGGAEMFATSCVISAILFGSLTKAIAIHQFQPVLVTLGAVIFFSEPVGWRRWLAIAIAFASVMLILRPDVSGWDVTALLALGGAFGLAVRDLSTKAVGPHVSSLQLSIFGYLVLIPPGLVFMWINGETMAMSQNGIFYMIGILASSMLAYITITQSVRVATFGTVMPFRYSRLIFVFIIGVLYFEETLDWQTIVGAMGILGAGLFIILRAGRA